MRSAGGGRGRGPYSPGVNFRLGPPGPVPAAVKGLLIANFAVYVLQIVAGRSFLWGSFALRPPLVLDLELWRLVTYSFLHGGALHLGINCLFLWMFGSELEQRWGSRFFIKYYLICGIGAGLFDVLMLMGRDHMTVGASGAVYGVLMAYGMWFPNREVLVFAMFPVRVRNLVVFLIALSFLQAVESSGDGIAHAAHLGGMMVGYLYLRWWGASGLGVAKVPGIRDLRKTWLRWRFRRLQKQRKRERGGGGGPTFH